MLPHAWYTICALIVIPIALSIAYCLPKKGGRRQPASRVCVRVLTPYPEPDWNQGKRWSPLGQPHPLTLVKVRWLGQGRSPKGAAYHRCASKNTATCVQVQSMHRWSGGWVNNAAGSLSFGLSDCCPPNHPLYTCVTGTISGVNIFGDSVLDCIMGLVECK